MLHPSAADVSSTRLIMAMEVLKSIGNNESIELISNIAKEHHQHYIRWGAIEAIACLDENRTKQLLNNALIDSHPEVRIAAIKTLEMNGVS
jgi:HEAT repeat protein